MIEKISLLCGALEPGANGVGDYALRLAEVFTAQGLAVQLIALSDPFVEAEGRSDGVQTARGKRLEIVRLSRALSLTRRLGLLEQALNRFTPDTVSLQYVLTSFHPKGLPWRFNAELARRLAPYRLHIMLHETWFGLDLNASLTQRLYGMIQKQMLFHFLRQTRPELLTLSNPYYQELLRAGGFASRRLPAFSNISPVGKGDDRGLATRLRGLGIEQPESYLRCGFFGGIFPNTPGAALLTRAGELAARANKPALILSAGRSGAGPGLFKTWARDFPELTFVELGALPDPQVKSYLRNLDYGLTGYPHYLLGKSSQIAAILAMGCPLLVGWQGREMAEPPLPEPGMELILRADRPLASWPNRWQEALPRGRCSVAEEVAAAMIALLDQTDRPRHAPSVTRR